MGLGIEKLKLCGFEEATKPSLVNFPIVGKGEFTSSLASEGCGEDQGQIWKTSWWSFVIKEKKRTNKKQHTVANKTISTTKIPSNQKLPKNEGMYLYQ